MSPAEALHADPCDAVLVIHHDFELDREALVALVAWVLLRRCRRTLYPASRES